MTSKKAAVVRVGIDVGAKELMVAIRKNGTALKAQSFANTAADHARLIRALAKYPDLIVCLEATGLYHLDLAVALHLYARRINALTQQKTMAKNQRHAL